MPVGQSPVLVAHHGDVVGYHASDEPFVHQVMQSTHRQRDLRIG